MNRQKCEPHDGFAVDLKTQYGRTLLHYIQSQSRDLPALAYEVCVYLADCYVCDGGVRIDHALAALGRWHQDNDFPDPTTCPSVIALAGQIRRGLRPRVSLQLPPSIADVMYLADAHERRFCRETPPNAECDEVGRSIRYSGLVARRNRAILLIGFWFGLTTLQVCKLRWNEVTMADGFLKITIDRTEANGGGTKYSFQLGRLPLLCPLAALEVWLAYAGSSNNYVFPCSTRKALPGPVSSRAVQDSFNKIMKNIGAAFSMRSLRYSLYFFLVDNGWSRQKILKYVPFYYKNASKVRIGRTTRDIATGGAHHKICADDMAEINSIIEKNFTRPFSIF